MLSTHTSEYSPAGTHSNGTPHVAPNGRISVAGSTARTDRPAVRHFSSKELIFCEGDPRSHVYQIETGLVMIYRMLADGRRQIIDFAHPGEFIGLGTAPEHFFNAEAAADTSVRSFGASALEDVAANDPRVALQLYKAVSLELAAARALLVAIGQRSASERVASFLLMLYRRRDNRSSDDDAIHLTMRRADIGDFLGLTIETVSRTITKFRAKRVIEVSHGTDIRILDAERLEELANGELAC